MSSGRTLPAKAVRSRIAGHYWRSAVENWTGSGEYQFRQVTSWRMERLNPGPGLRRQKRFAGRFVHELIALCAPRLTFISYGIPEKEMRSGSTSKGVCY